ncbi:protein argonaute 2-like [Magnolia sinica]|uniref:protein argonaute 2-like n=1 Tax=Magnolia sinica TaxID=86752 RepID=UPI0026581A16|nr:protein argonaute 2-like [Magnolia sinica]
MGNISSRDWWQSLKTILLANRWRRWGPLRVPSIEFRSCGEDDSAGTVNADQFKQIDRWAILDFTTSDRWYQLDVDQFTERIVDSAARVGVGMNRQFLFHEQSNVRVLSDEKQLYNVLKHVYERAEGKLQILFCPMESCHKGFNSLKWICKTEIELVTQCFLSPHANQGKDKDYMVLASNIKNKIQGSLPGQSPSHNHVC